MSGWGKWLWPRPCFSPTQSLSLMVALVAVGSLTRRRAIAIARQIQASNPLHINERVLQRFLGAIEKT